MPITNEVETESGEKLLINEYTLHSSMKELYEIESRGNVPLLFIDELNRSEFSVQQELMQVLLAREINGTKLPEGTLLMAAGNLENGEVDYQVNVMNPALKDRMTIVQMESDVDSWLDWGSRRDKSYDGGETFVSNIDPKVLEFIATFKEHLHEVSDDVDVNPTPRSWEKASEMFRLYKDMDGGIDETALTYALQGTVGLIPTTTFLRFLETTENKILDVEDIFTDKELSDEVIDKIKSEEIQRLMLTFNRLADHASDNLKKMKKQDLVNFKDFIANVPKDTMFGMIRKLVKEYEPLHDKMVMDADDYVDLHFETAKKISSVKGI